MPAERVVSCPSCGGQRETKAHRSTLISCYDCGKKFPAPEPPASDTSGASAPKPAGGVAPSAAPSPAGVTIATAKRTKAAQKARPRARGAAARPDPVDELYGPPADPPPTHPLTTAGKASGARGGASRYRERVRRGR